MKRALFVYGGWDGHTPQESAALFAEVLRSRAYEVDIENALSVFCDAARMQTYDLIVPVWTMGTLTEDEEARVCDAVAAGCGLAGWHGTMCDSFRNSVRYQWMTGGQFVAHPGDISPEYEIQITDHDHPITTGLADFRIPQSEQYYMHVDPSNHVLATTTFPDGVVMPAVWTRRWGQGRVAYASFGHTHQDFDVSAAREIVTRCMLWATRDA